MSPASGPQPPSARVTESQKIAVITGASQGIGAGLVAAFRRAGYAVVATSRSIDSSDESDLLTVQGDIAEVETAQRVVEQALNRFGRIDTLINNAGIFIGKPFTEYTPDDFAAINAVNLAGFFHITQRAVRQMVSQGSGHIVNITTRLVDQPDAGALRPGVPDKGRIGRRNSFSGHRIRVKRRTAERGRPRSDQDPEHDLPHTRLWPAFIRSAALARSATSRTESCISTRRRSSPARLCTSTAARPLHATRPLPLRRLEGISNATPDSPNLANRNCSAKPSS